MPFVAEVRIELKPGVADPEGANTKKALELLGFHSVRNVKSVHAFSIELDARTKDAALAQVNEMCKRLLVNPVVHAPRISLASTDGGAAKKPATASAKKARKPAPAKTAKKATKKPAARKPAAKKAQKTAKRAKRR